MIRDIVVLGAGSAGLLAAIALKRKIPRLAGRIVRSPEIGVIGVGEGTTPSFPLFLFEYLGISHSAFYALAEPTWKVGIRLAWGAARPFRLCVLQAARWPVVGSAAPEWLLRG